MPGFSAQLWGGPRIRPSPWGRAPYKRGALPSTNMAVSASPGNLPKRGRGGWGKGGSPGGSKRGLGGGQSHEAGGIEAETAMFVVGSWLWKGGDN